MANEKDTKDVKKKAQAPAPQKKQRTSLSEYFKGIKLEMKKVVWPTRKELGAYTVIVIVTCALFAICFWAVDSGVLALLKAILGITL